MTRWTMWLLAAGLVACAGDSSEDKTGDDDDDVTGDDDDDDTTGDDDDGVGGFDPVGTWSVTEGQQMDGTGTYTTGGAYSYVQTGYWTYDYEAGTGVILVDFLADGSVTFDSYYTQSTTTTSGTPPDSSTWTADGDEVLVVFELGGYTSEWRCSSAAPYDEMACDVWAGFQYDTGGTKVAIFHMERL